jgi:hypothetical protein
MAGGFDNERSRVLSRHARNLPATAAGIKNWEKSVFSHFSQPTPVRNTHFLK